MATQDNHQLEIYDAMVHISRGGSGQTLLLLHGAGGSANLKELASKLAEDFDVLLPDHPGFGLSDQSKRLSSVSDLAFYYLDFIQELGLKDIHLVGFSLGGWIAAEIAIRSTTNVKSIALVSSAGIHVKGVPKGDLFLWSPEELVRNLYVNQDIIDDILSQEPTSEELEFMVKNRVAAARYAWHPRFYNPDLEKWLHRIDVPTLIIWGDQDKIFPVEYASAFKNLIPHAQTQILKDCGHVPHMDQPEAFYHSLKSFLSETNS